MAAFRPSQYLRCFSLARADTRQEVLRTLKGIPVVARHLRVGTECLGDGTRALCLEGDWTPRALPDVFCLREGPPVSQVDPAMP